MASQLKNKLAKSAEQVQEAYQNGATLREISEVHGVSSGTVRNCLIEAGVKLRSRGRKKRSDANDDRVLPVEDLATASDASI
jgi:transposase-like protein